jgi:glycosyltransferase involved in cell wall biosynthesis
VKRSIFFFCGQPLAETPIGQRIGSFGRYLRRQGWTVGLSSVDPSFTDREFKVTDSMRDQQIDILGPTHYRITSDGQRSQLSPFDYFRECRRIAARIYARAESQNAEIIYLSTSLPASLFALAALSQGKQRLWIDIDDWSTGQFAARGGSGLVAGVYGILERRMPRLAERVTACSKELQGLFPKSEFIPNFIDLEDVPAPVVRTDAKSQKLRVVFASAVTSYHGHLPLLEALAERHSECAGLEFWILGDGDQLSNCQDLVTRKGIGDVVHFKGHLSRREMLAQLTECDIGVLPLWDNRLNRARFSLKLLDYLACGCAVVASKVGMAKEILTHRETAILSEPDDMNSLLDGVFSLAKDNQSREALRKKGLVLVQRYSENVICEQWMNVLNESTH